jgi:hypothetical protein
MNKALKSLIAAGAAIEILFIIFRLLPLDGSQRILLYIGLGLAVFAVILLLARFLRSAPLEKRFFLLLAFAALVFQLTLLSAPPDLSDDIYRYVWDGKLQYVGISPYTYAPSDPLLRPYHSAHLPARVNFPDIKTIYPPLAQAFFTLSYAIFGENLDGMKFIFILINMGNIFLFYRILQQRRCSLAPLLLFAWNPLLIMETAVNGHLDVLFLFFLLMALLFFYRQRWLFAGIALGLSVLSKLIPLIALPVFVAELATKKPRRKPLILFSVSFAATLVLAVLPYRKTIGNMLKTMMNYSSYWYFNSPHFHLLLAIFKDNVLVHRILFLVLIVILAAMVLWRTRFEKKIFLCFFAFIMFNPVIYPWYLIVLLGLLCIHENRIAFYWSGPILLSYIVAYRYRVTGVWHDSWPVMALEYGALAALILWQRLQAGRWRSRQT